MNHAPAALDQDESANESANGRFRVAEPERLALHRRSVRYRLDAAGELASVTPHTSDQPATGEGALHATIARLVRATDQEIVDAATRHGPLGPLRAVRPRDAARYVYLLNRAMLNERTHLDELHHWIASWSTIRIPARLAPIARLIVAFAEADPELSVFLAAVLSDPDPEFGRSDPATTWRRLMDEHFRVIARVDFPRRVARRWIARPDALVFARVRLGSGGRITPAARLVRTLIDALECDGGLSATIEPAALGRFAAEVAPYRVAPFFGLAEPETLAQWRRAAAELALWGRALRDLRALRSAEVRREVTPPLAELQAFADLGTDPPHAATFDEPARLAGELTSLLALRLQQIGAWPYPAGEVLGTFGRTLWSLWRPITDARPPRRCAWSEGCSTILPPKAHGNKVYCHAHLDELARLRSARTRQRERAGYGAAGGPPSS
jgi:hypothetical protein